MHLAVRRDHDGDAVLGAERDRAVGQDGQADDRVRRVALRLGRQLEGLEQLDRGAVVAGHGVAEDAQAGLGREQVAVLGVERVVDVGRGRVRRDGGGLARVRRLVPGVDQRAVERRLDDRERAVRVGPHDALALRVGPAEGREGRGHQARQRRVRAHHLVARPGAGVRRRAGLVGRAVRGRPLRVGQGGVARRLAGRDRGQARAGRLQALGEAGRVGGGRSDQQRREDGEDPSHCLPS